MSSYYCKILELFVNNYLYFIYTMVCWVFIGGRYFDKSDTKDQSVLIRANWVSTFAFRWEYHVCISAGFAAWATSMCGSSAVQCPALVPRLVPRRQEGTGLFWHVRGQDQCVCARIVFSFTEHFLLRMKILSTSRFPNLTLCFSDFRGD